MLLSLDSLAEFSANNYYLEISNIIEDKDLENTSYSSLLFLTINFVNNNIQDSVSAVSDLSADISHSSEKMSTISAIKIDIYEKVMQQAANISVLVKQENDIHSSEILIKQQNLYYFFQSEINYVLALFFFQRQLIKENV